MTDLTCSPQREVGLSNPLDSQDTALDPPSRNSDGDASGLVLAGPQQISKRLASGMPRWKPEVSLPCDRDDEINSKNFSKALAIFGSFVSAPGHGVAAPRLNLISCSPQDEGDTCVSSFHSGSSDVTHEDSLATRSGSSDGSETPASSVEEDIVQNEDSACARADSPCSASEHTTAEVGVTVSARDSAKETPG